MRGLMLQGFSEPRANGSVGAGGGGHAVGAPCSGHPRLLRREPGVVTLLDPEYL